MTDSRAVVSGASIAGLSAAFWLRRIGWHVTVLEQAPEFREGGQNVDVRGVGREVLDRMGLFDEIKARNTTETGTVIVDGTGKVVVTMPTDGPDGATAELEVLRGDFARALLDSLPADVEIVYAETIEQVDQTDDGVTVTTTSGRQLEADLLVVAEGVRSTTRDLLFDGQVDRRELGITMIFGTIERTPDDDRHWRWFNATRGRQVHLRPDNHGTTRAMLAYAGSDRLGGSDWSAVADRVRRRYTGAGWEAPRVLDGFDTSDDVYVDDLTQIRMPTWHRGRVCLIGDAAWSVTPIGGGGASLALISGYVLAAYLSTAQPGGVDAALTQTETFMRPLVDDVQKVPRGLKQLAYPQTQLAITARNLVMKVVTSPPFAALARRFTHVVGSDTRLPPLRPAE